jgi:polysaccharide export outer membrane protein
MTRPRTATDHSDPFARGRSLKPLLVPEPALTVEVDDRPAALMLLRAGLQSRVQGHPKWPPLPRGFITLLLGKRREAHGSGPIGGLSRKTPVCISCYGSAVAPPALYCVGGRCSRTRQVGAAQLCCGQPRPPRAAWARTEICAAVLNPLQSSPVVTMVGRKFRLMVAATFVHVFAPAGATQSPRPQQPQALLQAHPELVAQLRQRIITSGMTADQVRARLRAEGYPESLLDPYLPGTTAAPTAVGEDVLAAMVRLGIADAEEIPSLRRDPPADTSRRGTPSDEPTKRPDESGIFGLDVFRRNTSQFDPNLFGPVDANYRIGPGDRLVLVLTGQIEASHTLEVTREGFIVIPQVGQVDVANLTMGELEAVLFNRLHRVYSALGRGPGATTRFSVSPARLRSNQVYVIGDVTAPASYRISGAGTVLTALYAAGGPTPAGSLRRVEVRRAGHVVNVLDVYDYLLRGDASRDSRLENGDVVFVPVHGPRVEVRGEVLRPATYELKPGETLVDVVRAAGGFRATANRRRVQIERIVPPSDRTENGRDRIVIDVTSDNLTNGEGPAFPLENGDAVTVFSVTDRVRNRVAVQGHLWAPGTVGFTPGMRVSDALRLAGGVKPDVYVGQVLVSRLQSDSTRIQLRTSFRDTLGSVTNDFPLAEDDEIRVFSVTEFRPSRYVAINGAVRNSGRYPYREGMTMRDLVLLAGGLEEKAYLETAEVARLPDSRDGGRLAVTMRVPLDSSYLFERGPDGKYLGPPGLPAPNGPAAEVPLEVYDNVLILEQPEWELHRTVALTGEVRFPGHYSLRSKDERLVDVIRRAGGLTRQAYPGGVHFERTRDSVGRIGIDLPRALRNAHSRENLLLEDGDSIHVPPYKPTVSVTGAVNSPVAVAYVPGRDIDYYIAAGGGPNRRADVSRAYVTQPNGKVESRPRRSQLMARSPRPMPGGTVVVPERDPNDKRDYVQAVGAVAQVLAGLVAIIALIGRP